MDRTELEKKLEELTLEYLDKHAGRCNQEQCAALFDINMLKGVIDSINRRHDVGWMKWLMMGMSFLNILFYARFLLAEN